MNILVLDDNDHRLTFFQTGLKVHRVSVCRHANAAIKALKMTTFDIIFLDHDLEGGLADPTDTNCGSEVARFIANNEIDCPCIILHTESRVGRESMQTLLMTARTIPYSKLKKSGLRPVLKMVSKLSPPV